MTDTAVGVEATLAMVAMTDDVAGVRDESTIDDTHRKDTAQPTIDDTPWKDIAQPIGTDATPLYLCVRKSANELMMDLTTTLTNFQ